MSLGGLDPRSGALATDAGERAGPDFTRGAFLASSLADGASVLVANEPYASWSIGRAIGGRPFRIGLFFEGERLAMLILALADPAFGQDWSDWTPEREAARKAAHDAWLAGADPTIGDGRDYPWGFVSSIVDERSGGAEIVLRYGARLPERLPASPYPPIDFRSGSGG